MKSIKAIIATVAVAVLAGNAHADISKKMILEAQEEWGKGIVAIGKAKVNGKDYRKVASRHIEKLYDYDSGTVLFKPTKASEDQFRETFSQAHSYFVKGEVKEDGGFAINPWINVRFDNHQMFIDGDVAMVMGNYFFTTVSDEEVKVEYTFGYRLDGDQLKIVLHHSSLPFSK